jgi:hypothetical protein
MMELLTAKRKRTQIEDSPQGFKPGQMQGLSSWLGDQLSMR